jgi:thiosulfate/3-mercaptopyruvate sulfurtransferase
MPDTTGYAHPEVLVSTEWVEANRRNTTKIRIVESNEDVLLYDTGHIPEAVKIDWFNDLQDTTIRDYVGPAEFAELCARSGIANDTTVVFYGDKSNWWACYAFWTFKLFGHANCVIMNGGRAKWLAEGRPVETARPSYPRAAYTPPADQDQRIRAFRDEVLAHARMGGALLDVRSPEEYRGERLHMPEYPQEGALRGGHIPGAVSVPWAKAANPDGTFKPVDALRDLYQHDQGLSPADPTIAYCRIGERSSHTWFVLTYLLGFHNVKNYDGSWTEWGNGVGLPIARGAEPGSIGAPSLARPR